MNIDTTPRVRGLPIPIGTFTRLSRYNPACAGTTSSPSSHALPPSIQPRVCGDYSVSPASVRSYTDTTPRVRGLRLPTLLLRARLRYNPACAGTTGAAARGRSALSIQPRVCGDYSTVPLLLSISGDTTPRVRGLRGRRVASSACSRYNPACAGTTWSRRPCCRRTSIQPRVCGDYGCGSTTDARPADTTPRVRGLLRLHRLVRCQPRYNPACAGTTICLWMIRDCTTIQPRVCGDYHFSGRATV